jgi:hypothetical protein
MIPPSHLVPPDWALHCGPGRLGIGHDVATTDKKTSNPSSLTVTEQIGTMHFQRLVVRWKTPDPDYAKDLIESVLKAAPRHQLRSLCIDASSEKYHARNLQTALRKYCPVHLIVSGEAITFEGLRYTYKTLLGDLYCTAFEDGCIALPPGDFIVTDHRLVKKHAGSYVTETDDEGAHGDTFDSGKLSYWSLIRKGGPTTAHATSVGTGTQAPSTSLRNRSGLIGPIRGRTFGPGPRTLNT